MLLGPETVIINRQEDAPNQEIVVVDGTVIDPVHGLENVNVPHVIDPDPENQGKSVEGREAEREKGANAVKVKKGIKRRKRKGNTNAT